MGAWIWVCAGVLAAVSLLAAPVVEELEVRHPERHGLLESFGGGVSVAYAIVDLLPSLAGAQAKLVGRQGRLYLLAEHHVYVVALLGLIVFYGLEVLARRPRTSRAGEGEEADLAIFWIHVGAFAVYSAVIGALLVFEKGTSGESLAWFTVAMAFHFFVNATSLQELQRKAYRRTGRWVMAGAVLAGCGAAVLAGAGSPTYVALAAFVAGGILVNVLKEELPAEKSIRFGVFALGAAGFTALLLRASAAE
jgi:hypothetical protein